MYPETEKEIYNFIDIERACYSKGYILISNVHTAFYLILYLRYFV